MGKIEHWLESLGLEQYSAVFEAHDVDLDVLPSLTDEDLHELGVSLGHRRKILDAATAVIPASRVGSPRIGKRDRPRSNIETATAEGERRQVTVLYCDLVGSTTLSQRLDPEEYRMVMAHYHACCTRAIQRFDGYVAQVQGDGILAYFGYPLAHEAEGDRALRAALAIFEEIEISNANSAESRRVRIGVATGLVVVSHILAPEKTAIGETPNLAHRLQSIARPGDIIVSDRTRTVAGGGFDYRDLGMREIKGVDGEVRCWRVNGRSAAVSRFEAATRSGLTPLVGREQEIGKLLDCWKLARLDKGQVALLAGDPGIGKSRTVRAFKEHLGDRVTIVLQYQCSTYYTNSAFFPIIDHLERALTLDACADANAKLDKLEDVAMSKWGRSRDDCHLLARLLSIPCDQRYESLAMTPQRQKDETVRALVDAVAYLAVSEPTLMIFEDAHWADPTSIEVLDALIGRMESLPLLLLITFRPEFLAAWDDHSRIATFALTRLTREQGETLALRVAGEKPLPANLVSQIVNKADGVPLFLEELTKAVLESGMVTDEGDRYEYSGTRDRMTVPATLRDSLMARLDRLIPVKEIAQVGSVLGREFSYELVAAISPMGDADLREALDKLVASGLVFSRGVPPNAVYLFKHALVQDAAYDSLLKSKRQELHAKIALEIEKRHPEKIRTEPELLAYHYTAAGKAWTAIPLWQKAGELALDRMALLEAIAHLDHGLQLARSLPLSDERLHAELDIRSVLGTAWMALKGWPARQVVDAFDPALRLARQLRRKETILPISWGLWAHCLVRGRIAESLVLAIDGLREADENQDEDLRIGMHICAMVSHFWMGNLLDAQFHGDIIVSLYKGDGHRHIVSLTNSDPFTIRGLYAGHWVWMLGYPDRAVRISDEKDAHARRIGHPFDIGFALTTGAQHFEYRHEPYELLSRVQEAERVGRENSVPFISEVMAPMAAGMALVRAGRYAEAIKKLGHGIDMWHGHGANIWNPYGRSLYAEAMAHLGDVDGALRTIDSCIEQIMRPGWKERCHLAEILRLKAWMLLVKKEDAAAETCLRESIDWAREQQAKSWELRSCTTMAEVLASRGERGKASELLAPVYAWFTEGFDTHDLKKARELLDRLA